MKNYGASCHANCSVTSTLKGRCCNGRILREVQIQAGDEECHSGHDKKRTTGNEWSLCQVWHQNVQIRAAEVSPFVSSVQVMFLQRISSTEQMYRESRV